MEERHARPEETVMIGDSKVDVRTARNAGAWILGCAFVFGPQNLMEDPPDIVVNTAKAFQPRIWWESAADLRWVAR
jgi:phosphoglycolate phosphatase